MANVSVIYPDGRQASVDPLGDGSWRVLIGSSERCQIRVQGPEVKPVHAYLTPRSNHYGLLLAPGAKLMCNGREVTNDTPPTTEGDEFAGFRWVGRDMLIVELGGATIHVSGGC